MAEKWIIEFKNGSFLQNFDAEDGGPVETAMGFENKAAAEAVLSEDFPISFGSKAKGASVKRQSTVPKKPAKENRIRLQVDCSPAVVEKLDEAERDGNFTTRAEAIRFAIALLFFYITTKKRGSKIIVREPDGTEAEMIFI